MHVWVLESQVVEEEIFDFVLFPCGHRRLSTRFGYNVRTKNKIGYMATLATIAKKVQAKNLFGKMRFSTQLGVKGSARQGWVVD